MTASMQPSMANAEAFQLFSSAKRKRVEPGSGSEPGIKREGSRKKSRNTPHSRAELASADARERQERQGKETPEGFLEDRTRGTGAASSEEEAVLASGVDDAREVRAIEAPGGSMERGGKEQTAPEELRESEEGTAFRDLGLSDWLCR
jgi:hypothetical protein